MNRQSSNSNFLYKLHPLQWSAVALLILNMVAPFAPSGDAFVPELQVADVGEILLISSPTVESDLAEDEIVLSINQSSADVLLNNAPHNPLPTMANHGIAAEPLPEFELSIPETKQLLCYEVGPIVSQEMEDFFRNVLMPKGMALETHVVKHQEPIGFWVFIPPFRSKALGRLKVEEIKLKGVEDVVLLTRNNPRYAISLGIYNDKKFATKRLLEIESLGFEAKLDVRYKSVDEKWLFVEVEKRDDISTTQWDSLLANYPPVRLRTRECH